MLIQYSLEEKKAISAQVLAMYERSGFESQRKFAISAGFSAADLSHLVNASWQAQPQLIGDAKWVRLARLVGYQKNALLRWQTAKTAVYAFVCNQLSLCQTYGMTAILADAPGIGKTYAAQDFAANNKNVFYLNCCDSPSKREFMRAFARMVGVENTGKLKEQFETALFTLTQIERPLIILDEAGDLDNSCILVIKRIYNALEGLCGLYLIGSDGLKRKIEGGISGRIQGYTELFSRFGKKFSSILSDINDRKIKIKEMAREIAKANGITDRAELHVLLGALSGAYGFGDLRLIDREIKKLIIRRQTMPVA